jgi:folate-binding protein YgfZ
MIEQLAGLLALDERLGTPGAEQRLAVELLEVSGGDAAAFLQGQLSADVAALAPGASCWSLLLGPDGRLGELLRVQRCEPERFVLLGAASRASAIADRLDHFRFRVSVTLERRASLLRLAAGEGADDALAAWLPGIEELLLLEEDPSEGGDARLLDGLALLRGRVGPADVVDGMNPFELGARVIEGAVSFTKGCYTGQELVARIDARSGSAPQRLWRLRSDVPVEPGPLEVDGVELGQLLRSIRDPSSDVCWGSARVARRLEPSGPASCRVGGIEAVIEPL